MELPGPRHPLLAFRIIGLVPDRSVAWLVTDSWLSFIEDQQEWTGTTVSFDVVPTADGTEVRFTHQGWRRRSSATACAGSPGASTSSAR